MGTPTIKLPPQPSQSDFNLRRWTELRADPELAKFEGRIETVRYGHIFMSPPRAASHGGRQARIADLLDQCLSRGRVLTECPVSTADGVRAADVAWASPERVGEPGGRVCFPRAPGTCVEVESPGNTEGELQEKVALYFDAGAKEVWRCAVSGAMRFFDAAGAEAKPASGICPDFPAQIQLRPV
jgi:Uma2 family endonuclease